MEIHASAAQSAIADYLRAACGASCPRLLPLAVAKKFLGGEPPETFGVSPVPTKRRVLYDRHAIDARLDEISGLSRIDRPFDRSERLRSPADERDEAYDNWQANNDLH